MFAWNELGPMPFLFKLYRSTRSTREVLARLRPKFVLSKSPLAFLWPRDRTSAKRAKSFSLGVLSVLSVPSVSWPFWSIDCLLPCLSLYQGKCIEDNIDRTGTHWRKETRTTIGL